MQVVNGEIISFDENKNGWIVPTGIQNVELTPADLQSASASNAAFNISGQRVNNTFRGIQIKNGKKTVK